MKTLLSIILLYSTLWSETYYYQYGKKVQLTKLKESRVANDQNISYYQNASGQKIGVKNEILTKCKQVDQCSEIFEKYKLTKIKHLTKKILIITLDKDMDPFDTSQKLSLEEKIEFAHPNFIKRRQRR